MAIVTIENIHHRYADRVALDGVSFDVRPAECFGVLGPNGSGKSTLFKILTTLLPPTSGRAVVAGHDILLNPTEVRRNIGVVFQSPSLDAHLTVQENLLHQGRLFGIDRLTLRRRVSEIMASLQLADRARSLVRTLSGGLKRRVELAKCLLHRPPVLILDEPCSGLDPTARLEFWRQLDSLRSEQGVALLLTTHDMLEADCCDRLALLDQGKLVALDEPDALKSQIGGDCIVIESADSANLSRDIAAAFRVDCRMVNRSIRVEVPNGLELMGDILARFGPRVRSITLGKPTLNDVFVRLTGRPIDRADGEGAPK